ncbi:MFS transporter [Lipingzhangella sp. LS1_29]|uniref:MFS transporter n=1 Tax=Lipingzhangella rawalii TaxID=2055835 RepID=A0ABU2H656_9ACTN|nr:MFS transporter [Lipingzhangella rawalii]MDS1270792.1 MFS transporter [Lipingzhangella rawalii]
MTSVQSQPQPGATWREWLGLAALMLPVFMIATDMTVLFLAMPSIAADLQPSGTQSLWILHIGEFLAAGCVITMGRLTDRIGRRRLLMIGVSVYGVASVAAALSTSPEMLIAARALLGVAAATVMPSAIGLLRTMFADAKQFSFAFAVLISAFSGGMALGPPMGGILLEYFWWGAVFLANVPAAVLLMLTAMFLLPVYRDPSAQRLDLLSILLSVSALMALIFGLQEIADEGLRPLYVAAVLLGVGLGAVFVYRQRRLSDPLLDLRLFANPAVSVSMVSVLLVLLAFGGTDMLFAQHLQVGLGLSPAQSGAVLVAPAVAAITGTMLAPVAVRFMRPAYAISCGLSVSVVGALGMVLLLPTEQVPLLMAALVLIGLGMAPATTLGGQLLVTSAPMGRTGSATAVQDVSGGLGNAMGLAFLGSLAMVIYRRVLEGSAPGGLSDADLAAAQESTGGAMSVAERLPGERGAELMDAAGSAFAVGTQVAYGVAAVIAVTVVLLVLGRLRHVRLESSPDNEPEGGQEAGPEPQPSGAGSR